MSCWNSFGFLELQIWLIYSATACMSRKWQILVSVLWFTLPCLCVEVWLISLMVLGWYPVILWDLCLDWCAFYLLCYALVRIKLLALGAYVNFGVLVWLLCLLHFYAFIHMHCCSSFRYARCTMWRTWCGANQKMVLVDLSRRWKDQTGARMMECSPSEFHLKNSDLSRISGKPRSIISLLISKNAIEYYMLYVLLH
jgi:hypothetical protein